MNCSSKTAVVNKLPMYIDTIYIYIYISASSSQEAPFGCAFFRLFLLLCFTILSSD